MSWVDKLLKKVGKGEPISQHFNDSIDDFEASKGEDGAAFVKNIAGAKSCETATIAVGVAPIEVKTAITGRKTLRLRVIGNDAVYIGPRNDVTTVNGFPVLPGSTKKFIIDKNSTFKLYAIAGSPQTLKILETN
jgi:hypothetical protein